MLCQDFMKREVELVGPLDSVRLAALKMRHANIGFLPVCDPLGRVLGVITDRDITTRVCAEGLPADKTPVGVAMTEAVICCRPGDDIHVAEAIMGRYRKSRLVVLDAQDQLVGVISLSDIAQHAQDTQAARTLRQITEREAHP
jgi:CBS domain-containing protein